jgi:hypothetical protein
MDSDDGFPGMSPGVVTVSAYLPGTTGALTGPGRAAQVPLEILSRGPAQLVMPEATVRDERGVPLINPAGTGDLIADPCGGGGPLAGPERDREARVFGLTNAAYHAQRALRTAAALLGHPLPHLTIRIGMHESPRRWGGGHYRVAARTYDPPEFGHALPTGEIHLGGGSSLVPSPDGGDSYFAAPAHNVAIVNHEIGHHICRHTADFRLNRLRPERLQTNKKVAVDEGTCDMITAILIDTPDIYGWHRVTIPEWDRRRRMLSPQWTMAGFQGSSADPHQDGTIWASACWSARERVAAAGHDRSRFDGMLLRGLELAWQNSLAATLTSSEDEQFRIALKQRRYYSALLEALLAADPDLTDLVLGGMAAHGIRPGESNVVLRETFQAELEAARAPRGQAS